MHRIDPKARAWLEIDGEALVRNARTVQQWGGEHSRLLPMVKADSYGLGMLEAVARLESLAPWGYGVATVREGAALRAIGIERPVVVFTPLGRNQMKDAARLRLTPAISSATQLEAWISAAAPGDAFHIEVDTGMGRAGVPWDQPAALAALRARILEAQSAGLRWEGAYTHFHSADEPGSPDSAEQAERLQAVLGILGPAPEGEFHIHLANSAASARGIPGWGDLLRPGKHLYGGSTGAGVHLDPEPVVALRARVVHIRESKAGDPLGYGTTYRASGPERWATVAVGYADGLPRALGNRGRALLAGRSVPIIGRISMDMTVLDVTGLGDQVSPGDVATFLGSDGSSVIPLYEVAAHAGTIGYEILTRLSARIPRIWTDAPSATGESGTLEPEALFLRARAALAHAHAPYSRFPVGAALEAADGSVFTGCNVENASFGLTQCAERSAITAAVSAGYREFRRIAIVVDGAEPAAPCGACRQVLAEFAPDLEVWSEGGGRRLRWGLRELLPERFILECNGS